MSTTFTIRHLELIGTSRTPLGVIVALLLIVVMAEREFLRQIRPRASAMPLLVPIGVVLLAAFAIAVVDRLALL